MLNTLLYEELVLVLFIQLLEVETLRQHQVSRLLKLQLQIVITNVRARPLVIISDGLVS